MKKKCSFCKNFFTRNKKYSTKQWEKTKFCSLQCNSFFQKGKKRKSWGKHTEETKKKLSLYNPQRGKFSSESYNAIHTWLFKNFRKDKEKNSCIFCGSIRFIEFALKKGEKHTHKRENYLLLCSSCHKKYDYTKEWRKKISNSLKNRIFSLEWKKKISKGLMGRKMSEETKNKIRIYQKNNPRLRNEKGQFFISS